jgi:DNA-binding response OmpR family regulator
MEGLVSANQLIVLCVIADDQFRLLVGRVLRNAGFVVIQAVTCTAAMQSAQNGAPNIGILDVNLF